MRKDIMLKRIVDIFGSITGLLILSPVLLVLAILIRHQMGAPVVFRQIRPGKDAHPFEMLKFRSMRDAVDATGQPLSDSERLTPFGKKLRATSLDELPGLWNVLKGEMSLVGPRPLLMEYVPLYTPEQARRMEVRPGITGWAQVNGRNALSWDEKFALDVWYVENQSFWLDIKILWMTVRKVIARDGIDSDTGVGMERFTGDPQMIKVLYMGRKQVAAEALNYLLQLKTVEVVGVLTDSHLNVSVTSAIAKEAGIPLYDFDTALAAINDGQLTFDLGLSMLYWRKLKGSFLSYPSMGCINFHPAPLPQYKGVGGYNLAILEGLDQWAASAHFVDAEIDTGRIIDVQYFDIDPNRETAQSLERTSQDVLLSLFKDVVDKRLSTKGDLSTLPNDGGVYLSRKELELLKLIDLEKDDVERKVRAFWFPPYDGAFLEIQGQRFTLVNRQILEALGDPNASSLFTEPSSNKL